MSTETLSSGGAGGRENRPAGPAASPLRVGAAATALMTAALLVLVGGVVTAAVRSAGSSTSPAQLVPATAFAFAEIDLAPPGGQTEALAGFLGHFPGAPSSPSSLRDSLLRLMFDRSDHPHVAYNADVRPWLGNHAGIAGWLDAGGSPRVEFLLQSTDDAAARKSLHRLAPTAGLDFTHGYAVLSTDQHEADAALAAAARRSLAGNTTYHGDVAGLPGAQIVTGWADARGVAQALSAVPALHMMTGAPGLSMFGLRNLQSMKGREVVGVRATSRFVEVDVRSVGDTKQPATAPAALLTHMPDGTIAAAELADPATAVNSAMTAVGALMAGVGSSVSIGAGSTAVCAANAGCTPPSAPPMRAPTQVLHPKPVNLFGQIQRLTGLVLPADARTLLGSACVVSFAGLGGGGLPRIAAISQPADLSAARAVADRARRVVAARSGLDLAVTTTGNHLVVATSNDYAATVAAGGRLGDQGGFTRAMGALPQHVSFAAYVDLAAILPLFDKGNRVLEHFDALGMWATRDAHGSQLQLRLVAR